MLRNRLFLSLRSKDLGQCCNSRLAGRFKASPRTDQQTYAPSIPAQSLCPPIHPQYFLQRWIESKCNFESQRQPLLPVSFVITHIIKIKKHQPNVYQHDMAVLPLN